MAQAVAEVFPEDPPDFLARTPYGYHDPAGILSDLRAAGFADIAVDTIAGESRAASAREPAVAFCQGTPLRTEIEARDRSRLEEATAQAQARIAARYGPGPVTAPIRGHVVTALR